MKEKKIYSAPTMKSETIEVGVFGKYSTPGIWPGHSGHHGHGGHHGHSGHHGHGGHR